MRKTAFTLLSAFFWGWAWAWVLQYTRLGQFLALKRTWIAVAIGVGGDLLLAILVLPRRAWFDTVSIIGLSSIGIISRSLINELRETSEVIGAYKNPTRK
jgi:hypothetical protein